MSKLRFGTKKHYAALRSIRFRRSYRSQSEQMPMEYSRAENGIELIVQFWTGTKPNQHRVSFMCDGRCKTPPTYFDTDTQMVDAIKTQFIKAQKERADRSKP